MDVSSPVPSNMTSSDAMYSEQQTSGIEVPHENDVLCGRGVTTNRHVGNENFRSLVNCNKEIYVTSTKRQKMTISRSIVEAVRTLEPAGRFLEKDQTTGCWFDIGDKKAIEKTSQALRDGAANLRKQLSMDLNDPDFLSAVFDVDNDMSKRGEIKSKSPNETNPTKGKQLPSKANHRRTKSNPASNIEKPKAVKSHVKKQRSLQLDPPTPKASSQTSFVRNSPMVPRNQMTGSMPQQGPRSVPNSPSFIGSSYVETPPPENRPFRHGRFTFDSKPGNSIIGISRSFEQQSTPLSPANVTPSSSAAGYSSSMYDGPGPGPQLPPMSPGRGDDEYNHQPPPRPPISHGAGSSFARPERRGRPSVSPRNQRHPMSPPPAGPLQPGIHCLSPAGYHKAENAPTPMQWSPRCTPNSPRNTGPIHSSPCRSSRPSHPYHHPNHDQGNHRPPPPELSQPNYPSECSNYSCRHRYTPEYRPPISPRYNDECFDGNYCETSSTGNLSVPMLNNCDSRRLPISPQSSGYYPPSPHSACSAPPNYMNGPPPASPHGPPIPGPPPPHYRLSPSDRGSRASNYLPPSSPRFRQSRPSPVQAPSEFLPPPSQVNHRHHNNTERIMSTSPNSSGRDHNLSSPPPPLYPRKAPRSKEVHDLDSSPCSRHEDIEEKKSDDADDNIGERPESVRTKPPKCNSSSSPSGVVDSVEVVLTNEDDDADNNVAPLMSESGSPRQGLLEEFMNADNPAGDGMSVSPLPFEGERVDYGEEDPNSLLEVPENIMTLPISPCSPNDES
mmetsp:Transcript_31384/g.48146  ORF Transcript_31384/g.48146 Transcript_31384/m.48146 type:complete len:782 (+) Transcript_31384:150-2495(+)